MKHILTLLFVLLLSYFAFSGEIPGNKKIPGPVTITGTNSEINSDTGQPLVLQGTTAEPTYVERNEIANSSTPIAGIELINTTATTSGATVQYSPSLIWSSRTYYSTADNETLWAAYAKSNVAGSRSDLTFAYKNGSDAWSTLNFGLTKDGAMAAMARAETVTSGLKLITSSSATASSDAYSTALYFQGTGWNSSTSASKTLSTAMFCAPEQAAGDPIGVLKISYGSNSFTVTEAQELVRWQWYGALGMELNHPGTAGYIFDYSKSGTVKPLILTQELEPDIANDSTAFWKDSDDSKYYIILDVGGTQKKVEMT